MSYDDTKVRNNLFFIMKKLLILFCISINQVIASEVIDYDKENYQKSKVRVPSEIIFSIYEFSDLQAKQTLLTKTNKDFFKYVVSSSRKTRSMWRKIENNDDYNDLITNLTNSEILKSIHWFQFTFSPTYQQIHELSQCHPDIKGIKINRCEELYHQSLKSLKFIKLLEVLKLERNNADKEVRSCCFPWNRQTFQCAQIKELYLKDFYFEINQSLNNLISLERLVIDNCHNRLGGIDLLLPENLKELVLKNINYPKIKESIDLKNLTSLTIINCMFNSFLDLNNTCHVKKLKLKGLGIDSLLELEYFKHLEKLKIKNCFQLKKLSNFPEIKTLKKLTIKNCILDSLSDLQNINSLTALTLQGCHNLIDLSSLNRLHNLQKLKLHFIGVRDLDFLKELPHLTELRINRCENLIDTSALCHSSSIKKLILTDMNIDSYYIKQLENLENLHIKNNFYIISSKYEKEIRKAFPKVQIYRISEDFFNSKNVLIGSLVPLTFYFFYNLFKVLIS